MMSPFLVQKACFGIWWVSTSIGKGMMAAMLSLLFASKLKERNIKGAICYLWYYSDPVRFEGCGAFGTSLESQPGE
jgi:hypothetical protein